VKLKKIGHKLSIITSQTFILTYKNHSVTVSIVAETNFLLNLFRILYTVSE